MKMNYIIFKTSKKRSEKFEEIVKKDKKFLKRMWIDDEKVKRRLRK